MVWTRCWARSERPDSAPCSRRWPWGACCSPLPKLALSEQAEGTLLARACGLKFDEVFDEDDLYGAMDCAQRGMGGRGEGVVCARLPWLGAPGVVRSDERGISKVKGPSASGATVIVAITDRTGRKSYWLWPPMRKACRSISRCCGAIARTNTTLQSLLATLRRRFGIREATFVFDGA